MGLLVVILLVVILFALLQNPFKWAPHQCQVSPQRRAWIERTIKRLIALYGKDRFLQTRMILPDYAGFPRPYVNSEEFATNVFEEICAIMKLDPDDIDLEFGETNSDVENFDEEYGSRQIPGTYTADYDQLVTLNLELLHGFDKLVSVIAHELSHVSLDREVLEEVDHSDDDYEATIDVVSVFLGFGLFMANVNSTYGYGGKRENVGYLSLAEICYALAFIAWRRHEDIALWTRYLSQEAGSLLTRSFRVVQEAHAQKNQSSKHGTVSPKKQHTEPLPNIDEMLHHAMTQTLPPELMQNVPQIEEMLEQAKAQKHGQLKEEKQKTARKKRKK